MHNVARLQPTKVCHLKKTRMFQDNEKIVRITRQVFFFHPTVLPIISLGSDVKKRRRLQSFGPIFSSFSDITDAAGQSSTYFLLESRRIFLPLHVIK